MRALLFNRFDRLGGAGRAAFRLHQSLQMNRVESHLLVDIRSGDSPGVTGFQFARPPAFAVKKLYSDYLQSSYVDKARTDLSNTPFSLGLAGYDFTGSEIVRQADILNFHWVAGMLSNKSLAPLLNLGKPAVWTLHDAWPFTGGCHYAAGCNGFETTCFPCKQLTKDPNHIPRQLLEDRNHVIANANLTVVTPSRWLAAEAARSRIFRSKRIEVIANSLETDIFSPTEKKTARQKLGIPPNASTILFGADSGRERRKGFSELLQTMRFLAEKQGLKNKDIVILMFGTQPEHFDLPFAVKSLGYLRNDHDLAVAYSAADILALPSLEDNYPNIMTEAMACGTPVIAFDVGGMRDLIRPPVGRLVTAFDIEDFARAIADLLRNEKLRAQLARNCRRHMQKTHSLATMGKAYKDLFEDLLSAKRWKAVTASSSEKKVRPVFEPIVLRGIFRNPIALVQSCIFAILRAIAAKLPRLAGFYRRRFRRQ